LRKSPLRLRRAALRRFNRRRPRRVAPKRRRLPKKPAPSRGKTADERRGGKLTVNRALNEDEGARARSLAALKRAREKERRAHFGGQISSVKSRCAT
jgi:translation initiation factor IF-2